MRVTRSVLDAPWLARPPAGTAIYAVGDVHGCADLLDRIRQAIADDARRRSSRRKVIVHLGDYSSRGPDARRVHDTLIEAPLSGFETICLRGNHEDILLRMLDGDDEAGHHWLAYGGRATLASYGIAAPQEPHLSDRELDRLRKLFSERLPRAHLEFMRSLPISHREGGYLFVHAGLRPGVPINEQAPRDMLWIRKRFLESDEDFGAVVVHGHSEFKEPVIRRNRIGIDTSAYSTGRLTGVVLEGATCTLLQTEPAEAHRSEDRISSADALGLGNR